MHPTSTVRLKDGRRLEFAEYGHPDGQPFMFIGSPRHAAFADGYAWERGMRIIAPELPATLPRHCMPMAVSDIGELADRLGITEFGVIESPADRTFAPACKTAMPNRVKRLHKYDLQEMLMLPALA